MLEITSLLPSSLVKVIQNHAPVVFLCVLEKPSAGMFIDKNGLSSVPLNFNGWMTIEKSTMDQVLTAHGPGAVAETLYDMYRAVVTPLSAVQPPVSGI